VPLGEEREEEEADFFRRAMNFLKADNVSALNEAQQAVELFPAGRGVSVRERTGVPGDE
jgi:hypothetical protein